MSLRLWHPSIDPALVTDALGVQPTRSWRAGEARRTPKGGALNGTYRESYWFRRLTPAGGHASDDKPLEPYLAEILNELVSSRKFFATFRSDGGRIELFVGLHGERNYALELPPSLLLAAADLGVSLALDVYPKSQRWQ